MQQNSDKRHFVMVVDDDPAVRVLAEAALGDAGYRVSTAADGDEALAKMAREPPDILLLDVMMPGRDGFDVCRSVRATAWGEHLPIVMITGLDDSSSIEHAYEIGATHFVTKPVNWVALRHHVQFVLRAAENHRRLAESEERYALAARGASDGLWDWNLGNDHVYYSPRWKEMLGFAAEDIGTELYDWLDRIHRDDLPLVRAEIESHLRGDAANLTAEYRIRAHDGEYRWMLCRGLAIRDDKGRASRLAGSQTDITQRKRAEAKLLHDALHDGLTGLPNRTLFLDRVAHCLKLARRHKDYVFAVVFLDLDRFKTVNDSLGHISGDRLLREVGVRLKNRLRSTDSLARLGGDEFTILFDDIGELPELTHTIERMQQEIAQPFTIDDTDVVITASLGVTLSSTGYTRPEDMLRDADIAMYRAKATGKNRYEIFDTAMHTQVMAIMRVEAELRTALTRGELRVHYQPIVAMNGDRIAGFEALVRWQHPERGLLAAGEFLGVADETGLIVPIGQWVLREAVRQLAAWRQEFAELATATISVNLSSREFAQPDLLDRVDQALHDAGLAGDALKLEITETVLIENTARAKQTLDALKRRGVNLSIDDFGTGYSSFSYLHHFPFDVLKIDRSFVRSVDSNARSMEMVRAIVTLAHNLGLEVVAEGGETAAEVERLRTMGCEFSQGYAFYRPMQADDVRKLLRANPDTAGAPVQRRAAALD